MAKTKTSLDINSEISTLQLKMMDFYNKRFDTRKSPLDFSAFIINKINNYKSPLKILTNSYNIGDGIGDYNNQLDFILWLDEIFVGLKNVIITSNTFFEKTHTGDMPKEKLALKISPYYMHSKISLIEKVDDLKHLSFDSGKMFYIPETMFEHMLLAPKASSIDFFLNLATPIATYSPSNILYEGLSQGCLVQSRTEYGIHKSYRYSSAKISYERPMGVTTYEAGIKFYPSIENLCKQTKTLESKVCLLEGIEFAGIKKIIENKDKAEFINSHEFSFGYLQEEKASIDFLLTMTAKNKDKKKNSIFIVNLAYFKNINEDIELKNYLRADGFNKLEMIDSEGNTNSISLTEKIEKNESRSITLINFAGMSNEDKHKIIALSDLVGGSGNTSFSEMISSGKFPFIHKILWVSDFCKAFVKKLSEYNLTSPELTQDLLEGKYLHLDEDEMSGKENNIVTLSENDKLLYQYLTLSMYLVSYKNKLHKQLGPELNGTNQRESLRNLLSREGNIEKIMEAWTRYCSYLKEQKNVYDDFLEMIISAIVLKEFELAGKEQIMELLDWFPSGILAGHSFLHMAIEKNLAIETKTYLLNFYFNNELQLTSKIGRVDFTPLELSAAYSDIELFKYILQTECFIDKSETKSSIDNTFKILMSQENKNTQLLILLFNSKNLKIKEALIKQVFPSKIIQSATSMASVIVEKIVENATISVESTNKVEAPHAFFAKHSENEKSGDSFQAKLDSKNTETNPIKLAFLNAPTSDAIPNSDYKCENIKTLLKLINTLTENIKNKKGGREVWFDDNTKEKIAKLNIITNWLSSRETVDSSELLIILALIRDVCAIKRNSWGLFQPHSLNEFTDLLKANNLEISDKSSFGFKNLSSLESDVEGPQLL